MCFNSKLKLTTNLIPFLLPLHIAGHNARILFSFACCVDRIDRSFEGCDESHACFEIIFMILATFKEMYQKTVIVLTLGSPEHKKIFKHVQDSARICKQYQFSLHPPHQIRSKVSPPILSSEIIVRSVALHQLCLRAGCHEGHLQSTAAYSQRSQRPPPRRCARQHVRQHEDDKVLPKGATHPRQPADDQAGKGLRPRGACSVGGMNPCLRHSHTHKYTTFRPLSWCAGAVRHPRGSAFSGRAPF